MDHASSKSAEEWVEMRSKKWGFASIFIGSKTKQQQNKKEKQEKKLLRVTIIHIFSSKSLCYDFLAISIFSM